MYGYVMMLKDILVAITSPNVKHICFSVLISLFVAIVVRIVLGSIEMPRIYYKDTPDNNRRISKCKALKRYVATLWLIFDWHGTNRYHYSVFNLLPQNLLKRKFAHCSFFYPSKNVLCSKSSNET